MGKGGNERNAGYKRRGQLARGSIFKEGAVGDESWRWSGGGCD